MRNLIEGYLHFVDKWTEGIFKVCRYFVIAVTAWVVFAVIMRYIFNNPIIIAIDVAIIMAMFTYFLPIAYDLKHEIHPVLSFWVSKWSRRGQHLAQLLALAIYIWMGVLWTVGFWTDMMNMLQYNVPIEMMPYLLIGWVRVPMVIGMGTFVLLSVTYFGLTLRNLIKDRPMDFSPPLSLAEGAKKTKGVSLVG